MTPSQTFAYLHLARARHRRDLRDQLAIAALGSQGEEKAIKEQLKKWED